MHFRIAQHNIEDGGLAWNRGCRQRAIPTNGVFRRRALDSESSWRSLDQHSSRRERKPQHSSRHEVLRAGMAAAGGGTIAGAIVRTVAAYGGVAGRIVSAVAGDGAVHMGRVTRGCAIGLRTVAGGSRVAGHIHGHVGAECLQGCHGPAADGAGSGQAGDTLAQVLDLGVSYASWSTLEIVWFSSHIATKSLWDGKPEHV